MGDGVTTFNLPDLRGRSPIGVSAGTISGITTRTVGIKDGAETHTLTTSQLPAHNHTATASGVGDHNHGSGGYRSGICAGGGSDVGWNGAFYPSGTGYAGGHGHTITVANSGSDLPHNNMHPVLVVQFIIKY